MFPHRRRLASAAGAPGSSLAWHTVGVRDATGRVVRGDVRMRRAGTGGRPRTWPRLGAFVVGELTVSLGTCGWSHYPGGFAVALGPGETWVRGRRGFRATESQHLGPPGPGEDSEEAAVVRSWFEGGRDFPIPSAQPLKKEKHQLPSEEDPPQRPCPAMSAGFAQRRKRENESADRERRP